MLIRQEEKTPVGDYYHDYRIEPLFNEVKSTVDEFEFDSEVLKMNIETLMTRLKGLRNFIVLLEKTAMKSNYQQELKDKYNVDL